MDIVGRDFINVLGKYLHMGSDLMRVNHWLACICCYNELVSFANESPVVDGHQGNLDQGLEFLDQYNIGLTTLAKHHDVLDLFGSASIEKEDAGFSKRPSSDDDHLHVLLIFHDKVNECQHEPAGSVVGNMYAFE